MKSRLLLMLIVIAMPVLLSISCQKALGPQVNYQPQIDSLRAAIATLQKRSDSLALALQTTNSNLSSVQHSVDSLNTQIINVLLKIDQVNAQLNTVNADFAGVNAELVILKQEYANLLAKLNAILAQLVPIPSFLGTDLIAFYPFNGNANDSSGNGNHGIAYGATLTTDRFSSDNRAYAFTYANASFGLRNNEIYIPYSPSFNIAKISVSLWVLPHSYYWSGNPSDPLSTVINRFQNGYSTPNGQTWGITYSANGVSGYIIGPDGNGAAEVKSTVPLSLNAWHHIVLTFDQQVINLFIDGILGASINYNKPMNTSGKSGISIGESNQANGYWYYTDGKIDDIGIWGRALNNSEVKYLASH